MKYLLNLFSVIKRIIPNLSIMVVFISFILWWDLIMFMLSLSFAINGEEKEALFLLKLIVLQYFL